MGSHPGPTNIGDTVLVRGVGPEPWRGEVLAPSGDPTRPDLLQVHVVDPLESGEQIGDIYDVAPGRMSVAGDLDGMRASDACDDVDVTGRGRPYHRHAVTGRAHAHPGGGLAHTHTDQPGFEGATIGPRKAPTAAEDLGAVFGRLVSDVADSHRLGPETRDQTRRMAHLLVRQAMALADEGIGPDGSEDTDPTTLAEAVALVRSDFNDHELWDFGLIGDNNHPADGCDRCARRYPDGRPPLL